MMKNAKKKLTVRYLLIAVFFVLAGCGSESESFVVDNYNEFYVNVDGSIGTDNAALWEELREKYGQDRDNSIKRCIEQKEDLNMRCEETLIKTFWRGATFQLYGIPAKLIGAIPWIAIIWYATAKASNTRKTRRSNMEQLPAEL